MPTVRSWTEGRRAVEDLRTLLAFRLAGVRGRLRRRLWVVVAVLTTITLVAIAWSAATSSAFASGHAQTVRFFLEPDQMRALLPNAYAWFLAMAAGSAVSTGGGRELVARDRAVAFPISPATEHLGALLLAPLSMAWLIQAWALLGATAYAGGWDAAVWGTPLALLWLLFSTAVGQVVGWWMEVLRRGPFGVLLSRCVIGGAAALVGTVLYMRKMGDVAGLLPTDVITEAAVAPGGSWLPVLSAELLLLGVAVVAGLRPARIALRRPPREELRLETSQHPPRDLPTGDSSRLGDLRMVVRIDSASVWRSVPLRRGALVLSLVPGFAGLAVALEWHMAVILPGLVASGIALLFGVNAWCLDGRGLLWRESLPVDPSLVFIARTVVLVRLLLAASLATLLLVGLRAGLPAAHELAALVCAWLVATVQVSSIAATWSVRNPYAADLRSARATPAPPMAMMVYSGKLALVTTMTGMLFSFVAQIPYWGDVPAGVVAAVFAALFMAWSFARVARASRGWDDPVQRARVVTTVAA